MSYEAELRRLLQLEEGRAEAAEERAERAGQALELARADKMEAQRIAVHETQRAERAEAEADRSIGVLTTALQVAGERADRYEAALREIESQAEGLPTSGLAAIARAALTREDG